MTNPIKFLKENWKLLNEIAEEEAQPIIDKLHGRKPKPKQDIVNAEYKEVKD